MRQPALFASAPLFLFGFGSPCAAQLVGATWDWNVAHVDEDSGEGVVVGFAGSINLNSPAQNSDGRLISATGQQGSYRLIEIDPLTGRGSFVNDSFLNDLRALAFDSSDDLYAIDTPNPADSDLYFLDLTAPIGCSSIKTFIGETSLGSIQGMTFAPDDTL